MSMTSWHTYGFGICTDEINTTIERVKTFIDSAPEYKDKVFDWLNREYSDGYYEGNTLSEEKLNKIYAEITLDDILGIVEDHDDFVGTGLSCLICSVINAKTRIPLITAQDSNSNCSYVIMPSYYPWEVNRNTALQNINSEDDIKNIFAQYIAVLTNQTLDELYWGEQDIEGEG